MNLKCLFYLYLFLITIKEKIHSLFQRTQQTLYIVEIYRGDPQFFTYFKGRDVRSAVGKKQDGRDKNGGDVCGLLIKRIPRCSASGLIR